MFRKLVDLYGLNFAGELAWRWRSSGFSGVRLLGWFWQTKRYRTAKRRLSPLDRLVALVIVLGMALQIGVGIGFLVEWARYGTVGAWEFGVALLISYPLVWAHILAIITWCGRIVWALLYPKQAGRAVVCSVLEYQVRRLRRRHHFKVVAVAGSVGKTSTKLAIADLLGQSLRVRHQTGNYNDRVTVPLVFFGLSEPGIMNVFAWLKLFGSNTAALHHLYPYDVVVVELGTDAPGQLKHFAYLQPDITVVTAVSEEHMEFFSTLDAVAAEELSVFNYSKRVVVNGDDIAGQYLAGRQFVEYSLKSKQADYCAAVKARGLEGQSLDITTPAGKLKADTSYIGSQGAKFALAATAVANLLGVKLADIAAGLPKLAPFAGRLQILAGVKDSILIDDTYNASPLAVKAALDVLYGSEAPQRIAILGSMNELGAYAEPAHQEIGAYCDSEKLDLVVTIGSSAQKWLAPAAEKRGCSVQSFQSPYEAGEFVKSKLKKGAVVLAKGSQNGVFAEEALKSLLADLADAAKLVRQSDNWLKKKQAQFSA